MLELLKQYAEKQGLVAEPGFKAKAARFAIEFNANGDFLGVAPLPEMAFPRCPDLTQGESVFLKGAAQPLLSEVSNIALLTAKEDEEPDDKLLTKHAFFVARLNEAAKVDPAFASAAKGLTDPEILAKIRVALRNARAKPTDKATFLIDSAFPLKGEAWQDWWREWRGDLLRRIGENKKGASEGGAAQMLCFVTGEPVVPLATHPKVTGLGDVGGQAQVPFVGFDKEAFQSYGLAQSANAAVGEDAAYAYRAALDALLKKAEKYAGMKIAYWYDREELVGDDDPLRWLYDGDDRDKPAASVTTETSALADALKLLTALKTGAKGDLGRSRYFALALSGAGGRVMVRDWMSGSFADLAASVAAWFEDFAIADLTGKLAPSPKLEKIVTCPLRPKGASQNYGDWIKPVGAFRISLWRAALNPAVKIPEAAVRAALDAHRAAVITGKMEDLPFTLYARMGIMKAYLRRQGESMESKLEENLRNPVFYSEKYVAYHCGRLIATFALIQEEYHRPKRVDAGVIERYYGAASATPALVIGRLTTLSNHHLGKIAGENRKRATEFKELIADIFNAVGGEPPLTLNMKGQTLFALGYYQQIAHNRMKSEREKTSVAPAWDTDNSEDARESDPT